MYTKSQLIESRVFLTDRMAPRNAMPEERDNIRARAAAYLSPASSRLRSPPDARLKEARVIRLCVHARRGAPVQTNGERFPRAACGVYGGVMMRVCV